MANLVYTRGFFLAGNRDLDAFTLRLMLVSTGYTESLSHQRVSFTGSNTSQSPAHFEISVAGYSRQTLTGVTVFEDASNNFAGLDANDVTFSALTAGQTVGGAVLYLYTSSGNTTGLATTGDSGQDLLAFYDLSDTPTNGGDISVVWASSSAGSVLKITSTS